ncbi:MAG: hypothetical protein FWG29_05080 [Treponema sp.]|nr:hypothetical protein [Treponema sp.]
MKNKNIFVITLLLVIVAGTVFAIDVKIGKYVAGDSRNDLDYDYWIMINSDQTASMHIPGGSASGTWRYDGYKIYITFNTAYGELAHARGATLELIHADGTGSVLFGDDDAWWLQ